MRRWRISLAVTGIGLGLYGAGRLLTEVPTSGLVSLAVWLVAAVLIHDGVFSPLVVTVGWGLRRAVPDRPRRYLQAALVVGSAATVIAIPMIYREDTQPRVKSLLLQDYGRNLSVILTIVGIVALGAYAVRVAQDRTGPSPVPPTATPDETGQA